MNGCLSCDRKPEDTVDGRWPSITSNRIRLHGPETPVHNMSRADFTQRQPRLTNNILYHLTIAITTRLHLSRRLNWAILHFFVVRRYLYIRASSFSRSGIGVSPAPDRHKGAHVVRLFNHTFRDTGYRRPACCAWKNWSCALQLCLSKTQRENHSTISQLYTANFHWLC